MDDSLPGTDSTADRNLKIYDGVIAVLFTVGIAVNVWLMVDVATDGALTKGFRKWWDAEVKSKWERAKEYERDRHRVIAHAEWFAYEADTERGTENE